MSRHLLILLFFLIVITGCQKEPDPGPGAVVTPAQTNLDVSYGSDPMQKMDIYLPKGRTVANTKVIILIHGGAWATGDKSDFAPYVDTLKKRIPDYAIFNINYRLASLTGNFFPTQENDVKAAFEFILSKTNEYNISQKNCVTRRKRRCSPGALTRIQIFLAGESKSHCRFLRTDKPRNIAR